MWKTKVLRSVHTARCQWGSAKIFDDSFDTKFYRVVLQPASNPRRKHRVLFRRSKLSLEAVKGECIRQLKKKSKKKAYY